MKIKAVLNISDSCIRHVMKELRGEFNYKYTADKRRESIQTRLDQFEEALYFLKYLNDHQSQVISITSLKNKIVFVRCECGWGYEVESDGSDFDWVQCPNCDLHYKHLSIRR